MAENENDTQQQSPGLVAQRLGKVESDLVTIRAQTMGDRNNEKTFPDSQRGKLEQAIKEIAAIKTTVESWKGTFNKGVSGFFLALVALLAGFVFAKLTGGA